MADPLRKSTLFPPVVADMIAVGEETGDLENALSRIERAYEKEITYSIKTFTSVLEMIIILLAGLIVGFIALSILLPVFQMSAGIV